MHCTNISLVTSNIFQLLSILVGVCRIDKIDGGWVIMYSKFRLPPPRPCNGAQDRIHSSSLVALGDTKGE